MRIIIAGAGEVGTHLAKLLTRENFDISLMDENPLRLEGLDTDYDILTKVGSPVSLRDLREIGVEDADLFVAVTPEENKNMTACLIANKMGAKKTLARIDNYEYLQAENKQFFKELGLNHLIYPEVLAAQEIVESLKTNWMRSHLLLGNDTIHLCVVKVRDNAAIVNKRFSDGYFNHTRYRIVAIKRGSETIIPGGADTLLPDDLVYFVCTEKNIDFVREQAGKEQHEIKNVLFIGGTRIAMKAAMSLPKDLNIKILEEDRDTCVTLSEKLSNSLIINADGTNMDTLIEEGIQDMDAFVAVTPNSATNMFACLAAQRLGVKRTIAEIESFDSIQLAEGLDIGAIINKKAIAAGYIYQLLLDASVLNVRNLTTADAEIVEFMATEDSKITRDKIRYMDLPKDVNIGAIVRAGEPILVNGDTLIVPGDQVIVFCKSHAIRQLEKFFK